MEKRFNIRRMKIMLEIGLFKFERDLEDIFKKLPEDPDGVLVKYDDFKAQYDEAKSYGYELLKELVGTLPDTPEPTDVDEEDIGSDLDYETKFHHTTTGSIDGGKSLVLCPGQYINFDAVFCGNIRIPRHMDDNGRETYWNMFEAPKGDIIGYKDGKAYRYPCHTEVHYGICA